MPANFTVLVELAKLFSGLETTDLDAFYAFSYTPGVGTYDSS